MEQGRQKDNQQEVAKSEDANDQPKNKSIKTHTSP
jgi:hypothetical protein